MQINISKENVNNINYNIKIKKDYSISILRLISITFIVLCHFLQYYNNFLAWHFNIGVQLFLIISGYLYGLKFQTFNIEKSWKCLKKIFLDYYIFVFSAIILNLIFNHQNFNIYNILSFIFLMTTPPGLGHLWFIPLILFCYLICPFLSYLKFKCNKNCYLNFLLKFSFLIILKLIIQSAFSFFNYVWVLCFVIAFLFAEDIKFTKKNFLIKSLFLLLITFFYQLIKFYPNNFNYIYKLINIESFGKVSEISRLLTAFTLFIIIYNLLSLIKFPNDIKFLDFTDKYSYNIYLTHQIFILGPLTMLNLTPYIIFNIIITLCSIFTLTIINIILSKLIKKGYNALFIKNINTINL